MIKIVWRKDSYETLAKKLEEQYNIHLNSEPTQIGHHHVGIYLNPKDYEIIKPILEETVAQKNLMFFETKQGWVQLNVLDVVFIESFGEDIYMHTKFHETHTIQTPLYQLESLLKHHNFVRISKSYMVNVLYIVYIRTMLYGKLDLELTTGIHLSVTRSYVTTFKKSLGILKEEGK